MKVKQFRTPLMRRTAVEWILDHTELCTWAVMVAASLFVIYAGVQHVNNDRALAEQLAAAREESTRVIALSGACREIDAVSITHSLRPVRLSGEMVVAFIPETARQ